MEATETAVHNYFVDEAGDLTLFNAKGKIIIGQEGVSKFFMVGAAFLPDPREASIRLEELRRKLTACPYFNVPSMQLAEKKTAIAFHACKDCPEVRWEVFQVLEKLNPRITVAIGRKDVLAKTAAVMFETTRQKITSNDIYDGLVENTFKYLLDQGDEHRIVYAIRGKKTRAEAFEKAISQAKSTIEAERGYCCTPNTKIQPARGEEYIGLQVVDYYLWAVQRLFESGDSRFFRFVERDYVTIMDLDDNRNCPNGEFYGCDNPLRIEKILPLTG